MSEGITLKRIIDMDEAAELSSSDYALVDSATGGPKKFALGNELSSLKEEFTDIGTYEYPYAMVNGAYNTADGEPTASINYRIRTNDFISIEDFAYASAPSGYGVIVFVWDDSSYLGASVASYSYSTLCTAKEIKDKFPTATRVKVAFSNLSSQIITAIKWKTYGLSIVCKSNVEASISDQYETSENLVDFRTLRDGTSISTSTGAESLNADRWTSDFIPYDAVNHPKVIFTKRILTSCIAYDSTKTYIANIVDNVLINSVPENTAYLRICAVKTTVSVADAPHRVFVGYADVASGLTAHKMLNDSYYGVKRRGYINLNSITPYAESDGTYKTSFELTIERTEESYKNMILGIRAKYVGTDAPSIRFKYYFTTTNEQYNIYASKQHTFGGNGCYEVNEFRNPPFPKYKMSLSVIVTIPTGTTVYIDDLWNEYSDRVGGYDVGVRFNAHQGFIPLCIADTLSSFRMAAKLGFNRCVTIPKETSDGVLVCYHNDGAIGQTLIDENGNYPDAATQEKKISEITYSELSGYFVSPPHVLKSIYQDEKLPTLEEFFAVCSRTGMHPMLSVHPEPTLAGWNNIKNLAKKYGLLNALNIKIGYSLTATALDNPYAVFGSDIESYVIDVSTSRTTGAEYAQYLDTHLPDCKCRVVVEYFYSVITDERISETLAGGYEVACAELATQPTSEYKRLMSLGVTEFTNDNFSSVGLNW